MAYRAEDEARELAEELGRRERGEWVGVISDWLCDAYHSGSTEGPDLETTLRASIHRLRPCDVCKRMTVRDDGLCTDCALHALEEERHG